MYVYYVIVDGAQYTDTITITGNIILFKNTFELAGIGTVVILEGLPQ